VYISRRGWWAYVCSSLLLLGLWNGYFSAAAQSSKASLIGSVADTSGAMMKGAELKLLPIGLTTVSNEVGEFSFLDVAPGTYKLSVNYVGFASFEADVTLTAGQTTHLPVKLQVVSLSEAVMVTADRAHGEADAINQTRTSDNIIQVLPAEVIMSLPNANVADAIGRLPSVTLERIEGEGVYIQVRGTEPRLTNVTVDGITIPSPEPTVRQVRLDVLPADLIEAVEINKTLSANQDGDGIGGSVNLRTKSASERPYFTTYGNGGYTPILNGRGSNAFGGTLGDRFGRTKRFGLLIAGTYDYNGRGIDNIQPTLDPLSTFAQPFYDNNTIREYRYYRHRYGFSGSADYKLNDQNSFFLRGIYSDLKDWGDKWYYSPISTAISANGTLPSTTAASPSPKFYTSSKRPDASVGSISLGGGHYLTNQWLTWNISASRSYEVDSAGNPKADFSWIGPSVYCNYAPQGKNDLYRPHFGNCDGPNSSLLNSSYWALKDVTTSTGLSSQLNLAAAVSYAKSYETHGNFGTFEMGFKIRNGHKTQNATETVYDGWSTKGSSAILMSQLQDNFKNTDYYNGSYFGGVYAPVSDFNQVVTYLNQNLSGYVDGYKTAAVLYPNIFHTVERITAGYLMNTISFGRMRAQTGVRIEGTQMDTSGYNVTLYPAGSSVCGDKSNTGCGVPTLVTNNPSYVDILPSVQLHYKLTNDSALRAVYGRGIARPDAYQLVPYVTEDSSASPVTVAIGNPSLKPAHANNYDLLYENFLRPLGMIQGGFFFKQLSSPQVVTTIPGTVSLSNLPAGTIPASLQSAIAQYPGDSITQYINGQNAYIYGLELSFQQHFSYLPSVFSGLGVSANYSYAASKEKGLPLRTDQPDLQRQAANSWNLSPTYDTRHLSVRMGVTYNGPSIYQYVWIAPTLVTGADPSNLGPTGPSGDVYTLAHMQVDAQATYRIGHGFSAMASGLNLNNEVFGYYTGSTQFVNQREYYKPTFTFGLRYTYTRER